VSLAKLFTLLGDGRAGSPLSLKEDGMTELTKRFRIADNLNG